MEKQQNFKYPKGPGPGKKRRRKEPEVKGEMDDAETNGGKGSLKLPGVNIDPNLEISTEDSVQNEYLEKQQLERDSKSNWIEHDGGQDNVEKQQNYMYPKGPGRGKRGRKESEVKGEMGDAESNGAVGNPTLPEANRNPAVEQSKLTKDSKHRKDPEQNGYLNKHDLKKNVDKI